MGLLSPSQIFLVSGKEGFSWTYSGSIFGSQRYRQCYIGLSQKFCIPLVPIPEQNPEENFLRCRSSGRNYVMSLIVKYTSIPWIIPNSDSTLPCAGVFFHNRRTALPYPSSFVLKNVLLFTDSKLYLNSKFFSLPPRDRHAGSSE